MDYFLKHKKNFLLGGIAFFLFLFLIFNRNNLNGNKTLVKVKTPGFVSDVKDFHLTGSSLMIWDLNYLYIATKDGEMEKKIDKSSENLKVFWGTNSCYLYDSDLKKIYRYSESGEFLGTSVAPYDVYNIISQGQNTIVHMKDNGREVLSLLKGDSLSEIYKTQNFIVAMDFNDLKNYVVAEINPYDRGYKTTLSGNGKFSNRIDYVGEVALDVKVMAGKVVMVTDKNIYILNGEDTLHKEIPNISDVLYKDSSIYLLHSGILSRYNMRLEEGAKFIIAANVTGLADVGGSIYTIGESDLGGEIGKKSEFYTRLGSGIEKIEIGGVTVAALKDGKLNIYKIIQSRNADNNKMRDLSEGD